MRGSDKLFSSIRLNIKFFFGKKSTIYHRKSEEWYLGRGGGVIFFRQLIPPERCSEAGETYFLKILDPKRYKNSLN